MKAKIGLHIYKCERKKNSDGFYYYTMILLFILYLKYKFTTMF